MYSSIEEGSLGTAWIRSVGDIIQQFLSEAHRETQKQGTESRVELFSINILNLVRLCYGAGLFIAGYSRGVPVYQLEVSSTPKILPQP